MNFEINNNGNTANDIRGQFGRLHDMAEATRAVLNSMDYSHGRNYQTLENAEDAQLADLGERREMAEHLQAVIEFAITGCARAIRQRDEQ